MTINEIREGIATSMNIDCDQIWCGIVDNATPGPYGVEDIEFYIDVADLWVDVQKKTYNFKTGMLSFSARLLSSREEDGFNKKCRKKVSGGGVFAFTDSKGVRVRDISINESLDLFEE